MSKIIITKDYDEEYFDFLQKENNKTPYIDPETKIIFLDIDGVLNNSKWLKENKNNPIDPAAVNRINVIMQKTDAKIVISSSWRIKFLNTTNSFESIKEFFQIME
jgi:hypothetical protein